MVIAELALYLVGSLGFLLVFTLLMEAVVSRAERGRRR